MKGLTSTDTLFEDNDLTDERGQETPDSLRVTTADFLARQAALLLTDIERGAVAARTRFWSMPHLRRADLPDPTDTLP